MAGSWTVLPVPVLAQHLLFGRSRTQIYNANARNHYGRRERSRAHNGSREMGLRPAQRRRLTRSSGSQSHGGLVEVGVGVGNQPA